MTVTAVTAAETREPSNLFYQTRTRRPVVARAEGIYIWDRQGRRYIDGSSGAMVANIGHGNPRVLAAMRRQMEEATFAYRLHFENEAAETLARRIAARMPAQLDRVFFVSGGSEAVESCLKLARQNALATGQASRYKVISRFPSYHGATLGALALTGYAPMTTPFAPMMHEMPKVPAPTCYLDDDNLDWNARGLRYAEMLREEIRRQGAETVLAFIMEPVGGAATGALVAPDSYYTRIREICDEYGVLLILDEVMCGMGRTGTLHACEQDGVAPDLMAIAKGLGAGLQPIGAVLVAGKVFEAMRGGSGFFQHGHTYMGHPTACAAALAVQRAIQSRNLLENVRRQGEAFADALRRSLGQHPHVGDIRGRGLFRGVELVADRDTKEPFDPALNLHAHIKRQGMARGLMCYPAGGTADGVRGDHVLLAPPFIIEDAHIDEIVDKFAQALDAALDAVRA